jgi:drug/metabolite transporter (DMT)-like permease
MNTQNNFKIISFAILSCLLWSTAFAGIKIGLQYCDPMTFAGVRFIISGLLLLPLWFLKKNVYKRILRNWKLILAVALFQTYILYALMFWALLYVSGTVTAIIVGSSPLITAITTHFFTSNDKLNRKKLLSFFIGITGIVVIALNKYDISGNNNYILGIMLLILSSFASAIGNIIVSTRKSLISPVTLTSTQMFIGGIFLLITALLINGTPHIPKAPAFYAALLWLSFISAAAFSIWFILLKIKDIKVSDLNVWKFIIPIFGAVFSWIFVSGEHPEFITILGMLIAASSILMYNLVEKESKNQTTEVNRLN